jgi:TolB-like protein
MNSGEVDARAARGQLERILASETFNRNERLSQFLRFVVEHHLDGADTDLKESVIAVQVFGRRADYDPKLDSIVRTEASRLRSRLADYYAQAGSHDDLIIEVPKGGYTPLFRRRPVERQAPKSIPRGPAVAAGLLLVVALIGSWWWFHRDRQPVTIAVLPLENLTKDPGNDYFADGLTDEIIRNLAMIDGLAVRSRTSSFAFRGKQGTAREVGAQLKADYLLEGSALRSGTQLRVNTQLIRVRDDFTLWSGRFDRELADVFAIQDEISRGIVNNLRLNLGRGRRRYETSVEAYDLYLRARALQYQGKTVPSIPLFEQVIGKDPTFAPAYAGLAAAYVFRSGVFFLPHPSDELAKMRAAAEKGIELDPLLPEAHDALGMAYARDAHWDLAEKSFHRAIELDPNSALTYNHFAIWFLMVLGRVEEAVNQLRLAERLDPLARLIHQNLAFVLVSASRYDEAADQCHKLAQVDPCIRHVARARLGQGRIEEAIQLLTPVRNDSPNEGFLGYAYARSGRGKEAQQLEAANPDSPQILVLIYAGLGDKDRAFEALERMAPEGPGRIGQYLTYPELSLLRGDPRLTTLRRKVGLPE